MAIVVQRVQWTKAANEFVIKPPEPLDKYARILYLTTGKRSRDSFNVHTLL